MTRVELETRIHDLARVANSLDQPDKTFMLNEIDRIIREIDGMALAEFRQKLEQIQLVKLREVDEKIAAARDATKAHQFRVEAVETAIGILRTVIGPHGPGSGF
jgi:uncharacterized membrane protein YccC